MFPMTLPMRTGRSMRPPRIFIFGHCQRNDGTAPLGAYGGDRLRRRCRQDERRGWKKFHELLPATRTGLTAKKRDLSLPRKLQALAFCADRVKRKQPFAKSASCLRL